MELKRIMAKALELFAQYVSRGECPAKMVHIPGEDGAELEFVNGFIKPNNKPPHTCYLYAKGERFRRCWGSTRWEKT